jgi:hypothetical protein
MVGRLGTMVRTVTTALAAMIAAAAPTIAYAGDGDSTDAPNAGADVATEHHADAKTDAKPEAKKHAKKGAHASKKTSHAKPAPAAGDKTEKAEKAKPVKKAKKTASRGPSKKAAEKKAESKAPPSEARGSATGKPCFGPPVTIDRGGLESETLSLVTCKGSPIEASRVKLSALARPWGSPKPEMTPAAPKTVHGRASAPALHLLDRGLATRLDAIARHFPGHALSVVSGYRPKSRGSLHQSGRAIDVRVLGVTNAELVSFCRSLPDTGCGYYPNSSFVHVDVRNRGTGKVTWIDASGPGEAPRYVSEWPPREDAPSSVPPPSGDEAHEATEPTAPASVDDAYEDASVGGRRTPSANPPATELPGLSLPPVAPSLLR